MTAEARAEAERRYPAPTLPGDNIGLRVGFVEGAEWKGTQDAKPLSDEQYAQVIIEAMEYLNEAGVYVGDTDVPEDELRAPRYACVVDGTIYWRGLIDVIARALSGVESSDEGEADGE
jgi:hypothetical protein